MSTIVDRFEKIKSIISKEKKKSVEIIAISKTFPLAHIMPLIDHGHKHFGENKVQEADIKWREIKLKDNTLKLHLVGKLQSNKAKKAVEIFDYIHSLDSQKLADVLAKSQISLNRSLKYFIQVNLGNEIQKSGIPVNEIDSFYDYCIREKKLNILGLMILPPNDNNSDKYFKMISEINSSLSLKDLSMGMSSDYISAVRHNSTFLRIGSLIFGKRN